MDCCDVCFANSNAVEDHLKLLWWVQRKVVCTGHDVPLLPGGGASALYVGFPPWAVDPLIFNIRSFAQLSIRFSVGFLPWAAKVTH
jgi:hypothetical protein